MKNLVDNNIPIPIFADIYLDYIQMFKEPWNYFGAHMIVLAGYDEKEGGAYYANSKFSGL